MIKYDVSNLDEYLPYTDNLWYISRVSINPLYEDKYYINIEVLIVKVWEI